MCHEAFDAFLPTLNFIPDLFDNKMLEKLHDVVFSNSLIMK